MADVDFSTSEKIEEILETSMRLDYLVTQKHGLSVEDITSIRVDSDNYKIDINTEDSMLRFKAKGTERVLMPNAETGVLQMVLDSELAQGIYAIVEGFAHEEMESEQEGNKEISPEIQKAFIRAAQFGELDKVKELFEEGVDIDARIDKEESGFKSLSHTAITAAAQDSHTEIIEWLIENGANVNSTDSYGASAIVYAADEENAELVKLLIENGADVNITSSGGSSALKYAREMDNEEIIQMLLEAGARDENSSETGYEEDLHTGLGPEKQKEFIEAAQKGDLLTVKVLFGQGIDVNERLEAENEFTLSHVALTAAAQRSKKEIVEFLIYVDADVNATDSYGCSAITYAADEGNVEIVKMLIEAGADVNLASSGGTTALANAKDMDFEEVVQILVDAGATE